ncbi:hypothetical protein CBL_11119 [Carabus blaptoides fortunei]
MFVYKFEPAINFERMRKKHAELTSPSVVYTDDILFVVDCVNRLIRGNFADDDNS